MNDKPRLLIEICCRLTLVYCFAAIPTAPAGAQAPLPGNQRILVDDLQIQAFDAADAQVEFAAGASGRFDDDSLSAGR